MTELSGSPAVAGPALATPALRGSLPRMSHSRYEKYASCGEMYRLEKIEKVPRTPSIYAVGGIVFHQWTDEYDLNGPMPEWAALEYWNTNLVGLVAEREEESGFPLAQWDTPAFGRDANQKALDKFLGELGPDMIRKYIQWRDTSGWTIAEDLPPDQPYVNRDGVAEREPRTVGVEYRMGYQVGTVRDLALVDRIMYTPDGELVALDTKTWAKKREGPQLASYRVALIQNGVSVSRLGYYEARKGEVTGLNDYRFWDEDRLAALHEQAAHMIAGGWFLPRPSNDCNTICPVRRHCAFAP